MAHPILAFCPYLPLNKPLVFADWEIGPVEVFDGRWVDQGFERQAKAFLVKFVDGLGKSIQRPSLLCRRDQGIDGAPPSDTEITAIEAAIGFAFLDQNPRHSPKTEHNAWTVVTSDNTEPYFWPVDVEAGYVAVRTGKMVQTLGGGYRISDKELAIRPPLDLHMPLAAQEADPRTLEAVYRTVLSSESSPGANIIADRLKVAIDWFMKAWRNTSTVQWSERLVFLKIAFEALTATDKSHISGERLRDLFRAEPNTAATDSELLMWSPAESVCKTRHWTDRSGVARSSQVTELEHWFGAFADARNTIIHNGVVPTMSYTEGTEYDGQFVFIAEFLFRAVVKVTLSQNGYPDLWRSRLWQIIKEVYEKLEKEAASSPAS